MVKLSDLFDDDKREALIRQYTTGQLPEDTRKFLDRHDSQYSWGQNVDPRHADVTPHDGMDQNVKFNILLEHHATDIDSIQEKLSETFRGFGKGDDGQQYNDVKELMKKLSDHREEFTKSLTEAVRSVRENVEQFRQSEQGQALERKLNQTVSDVSSSIHERAGQLRQSDQVQALGERVSRGMSDMTSAVHDHMERFRQSELGQRIEERLDRGLASDSTGRAAGPGQLGQDRFEGPIRHVDEKTVTPSSSVDQDQDVLHSKLVGLKDTGREQNEKLAGFRSKYKQEPDDPPGKRSGLSLKFHSDKAELSSLAQRRGIQQEDLDRTTDALVKKYGHDGVQTMLKKEMSRDDFTSEDLKQLGRDGRTALRMNHMSGTFKREFDQAIKSISQATKDDLPSLKLSSVTRQLSPEMERG